MADMHILRGDGCHLWAVVCHFLIPDVNNVPGVSYRAALVASGIGGTTAMIEGAGAGQITTAEKAKIETGEVYERPFSLCLESGGTNAEQRVMLRDHYATKEPVVIAELQSKLRYWGHTEAAA